MTLLVTLPLHAEACAEAARAHKARLCSSSGGHPTLSSTEGQDPLVTRARRHSTRRALGDRGLLIFRAVARDAAERTIDTQPIGALVEIGAPGRLQERPRDSMRRQILDAAAAARPSIEAALAAWRHDVSACAERFAAARAARERAIASSAAADAGQSYQPGLFDRRAERAHDQDAFGEAEHVEHARTRLRSAIDAGIVTIDVALVLVLTP